MVSLGRVGGRRDGQSLGVATTAEAEAAAICRKVSTDVNHSVARRMVVPAAAELDEQHPPHARHAFGACKATARARAVDSICRTADAAVASPAPARCHAGPGPTSADVP
jgi:hypothetical protein